MTHYLIDRFSSGVESTLGILFRQGNLEAEFMAFTLEDEARTAKVYGETRIPAGVYLLKLRKFGGFHKRYTDKFDFHEGMIEITNVPNFTDVLVHIGNDDDDTAGCLLTGDSCSQNITAPGFIGSSTSAYERVYKRMLEDMQRGPVWIEYRDRA